MSLIDTVLNLVTKQPKDPDAKPAFSKQITSALRQNIRDRKLLKV
jgi:hypothetical protein